MYGRGCSLLISVFTLIISVLLYAIENVLNTVAIFYREPGRSGNRYRNSSIRNSDFNISERCC